MIKVLTFVSSALQNGRCESQIQKIQIFLTGVTLQFSVDSLLFSIYLTPNVYSDVMRLSSIANNGKTFIIHVPTFVKLLTPLCTIVQGV